MTRAGYGGIGYGDFHVGQGYTRFIEDEPVPSDATIVDHTWRYVNKNGSPDRRFNNNRQLPILQLGVLTLTSSTGLNIRLNTSNPQQSIAFSACWQRLSNPQKGYESQAHSHPSQPSEPLPSTEAGIARSRLGVAENASPAEVSAAYHHLAQMYHPDKVAGLAPEFRALADTRMKEINAAYEVLKQ